MSELHLSPGEQEKLNEFQVITAFPEEQHDKVVALLRNNYWNLEVALSKYFDGHLEEEAAREAPQEREASPPPLQQRPIQHGRLAFGDFVDPDMLQMGHQFLLPQLPIVRPISNRWLTQPGLNRGVDHFGFRTVAQTPLLFILLLIPRTLTFLLSGLGFLFNLFFPSSPDGIPQEPTMTRFNAIEYYEKLTQDKSAIEFYKGTFNEAFNQAKQESKFILLVLINSNDTSNSFIKQVLNNERVSSLINSEDMIVYLAHVSEPQGLEIARSMRARSTPSVYLLGNVASGPSGVSSMSVCGRISVKSVNSFIGRLRLEVEKYKPELITKRIEQEELEYARKIREMQDRAYEESLIADRIKKEQKEQEVREKLEKSKKKKWQESQKRLFYASLLRKFDRTEVLEKGQDTTIRFKLPSGEGITQRFGAENSLFDVYSFIDLKLHMKKLETDGDEIEELKEGEMIDPEYKHIFGFELISPFPRYTVPVDAAMCLKNVSQLWPNGSVMLEFFDESSDEENED